MSGDTYALYGLCVRSEIPLPLEELEEGGCRHPDVMIKEGTVRKDSHDHVVRGRSTWGTEDDLTIEWESVGRFRITDARRVVVDLEVEGGQREDFVQRILQGVCMGVLQHQRGRLTLHGSAVVIGGEAAAFIGPKRAGKSTTAAALRQQGCALVTDDIVSFHSGESHPPHIYPANPELRLWPDAAEAFHPSPDPLPRVHARTEKRLLRTESVVEPVPLGAIYVLAYDADLKSPLTVGSVAPHQCCMELIRNSYAMRFLGDIADARTHLAQCQRIAQAVPVRRLVRQPSLESLEGLKSVIQRDLAESVTKADT